MCCIVIVTLIHGSVLFSLINFLQDITINCCFSSDHLYIGKKFHQIGLDNMYIHPLAISLSYTVCGYFYTQLPHLFCKQPSSCIIHSATCMFCHASSSSCKLGLTPKELICKSRKLSLCVAKRNSHSAIP